MIGRLTGPEQFRAVYRRGRLRFGRYTAVHVLSVGNSDPAKVGLSVSKRVGTAVVRNRIKRRLREIARAAAPKIPQGVHIVIGCKASARDATFQQLQADVLGAMRGLGLFREHRGR